MYVSDYITDAHMHTFRVYSKWLCRVCTYMRANAIYYVYPCMHSYNDTFTDIRITYNIAMYIYI